MLAVASEPAARLTQGGIVNPLRFQAHGMRRKRFPDVVFARGRAKQISYSRDDKELDGRPTSRFSPYACAPAPRHRADDRAVRRSRRPRQLRFQAASRTHTVFTSRPSACTAKYVRDLTGTPSRRTGPSKRPLGSMRKPPQRPGAA